MDLSLVVDVGSGVVCPSLDTSLTPLTVLFCMHAPPSIATFPKRDGCYRRLSASMSDETVSSSAVQRLAMANRNNTLALLCNRPELVTKKFVKSRFWLELEVLVC